jgi:glycosyltransferase involved in cell wall biosynthesis
VNLDLEVSLKVFQVFLSEKSRKNMETLDYGLHEYDYEILFDKPDHEVSFWQRIKRIYQAIKKENPDVINITGYYDMAIVLPALWFRLNGVHLIMSIDSTLGDNQNSFLSYHFKRLIFRQIDGFFSYGTKSSELIKFYLKTNSKILLANNAVDNDRLLKTYLAAKKERSNKNFIFVGRFIKEKNLTSLIEAFSMLENNDWGIILVGTGPEEEVLKKQAKGMSKIKFHEPVAWYDVPKALALADVFVLPSISEPWGLVVNEAMACGLPVIVSEKCGSAHDLVVQSVNGFTFVPESVEQLKDHLNWFLKNSEKLEKMGKESQKIISTHRPEIVAKQMYDAFKTFKR